jgi:N-acetylated-alpha-linked acidic dipeptidase
MRWRTSARLRATLTAMTAGAALLVFAMHGDRGSSRPIEGFGATSLAAQHAVEQRLARFPSRRRLDADHRFLTAEPHVAGSPRDHLLAEWTRDQWQTAGLDSVEIVEHDVLLPYPGDAVVEMLGPRLWRATLREGTEQTVAYHAYGASGDVTAPVVYAGSGSPSDFDWLSAHGIDVRGTIVLLRYSVPYSYRGFKVFTAQQRGAAAVLMYADPVDEGGVRGPADRVQRGGVGFDFFAPGDPLTPGWASTPDATRLPHASAQALPGIMSIPISAQDAVVVLNTLGGPASPGGWKGALESPYRVGPGATLRVRVSNDEAVRPIWTVIGRLNGATHPDQWVIAGNHRDAWVYGGVDPSSGSAIMMEMARALGSLARNGLRPARTIVLASWDAEEFALTSSTEWGEEHEDELREKAVAYLNVDAAVSGSTFSARAVPSLARLVASTAGTPDSSVDTRVGGGSDYTVFLNFLGVPIVDMRFDGAYTVYHSAYDTHDWVARFADPGFLRHAQMTRIWSALATRIANADVLPLDEQRYARRIGDFLAQVRQRWMRLAPRGVSTDLAIASAALGRFQSEADAAAARSAAALRRDDRPALDAINQALMRVEPALLDLDGVPGRPWYRHQVYAPAFTYEPEMLPGLSEAVDSGSAERVAEQERHLAAAFDRAAKALTP